MVNIKCRGCDSHNLFTAIDLGLQPLAGGFISKDLEQDSLEVFENRMVVCNDCGLGQLSVDMDPDTLYSSYNWRTSTSKSYVDYIHTFADEHIIPNINPGDWVLEIACNDGYLLKYLMSRGIDVLGVDPAKNIARYAICDGVPVITDFFDEKLATDILSIKGTPKWIVANNVMAHTPNIQGFMEGISILSSKDTTATIENPTVMNILNKDHFDVIFHEHYSYLSAHSVDALATKFDLSLFKVESVHPQGGSNRYWISKNKPPTPSVASTINEELSEGLLSSNQWDIAQERISKKATEFFKKVESIKESGGIICGVGASAKSTVVLNFAKIAEGRVSAIADDVKEKQGFLVPKVNIPIVSMEEMLDLSPTDIIVFAWNIREELEKKLRALGYLGSVWTWS